MSKLSWDAVGYRYYETGVDHGVLYVKDASNANGTGYKAGVAWNGLVSVNEKASGGELSAVWADNIKYLNLRATENFGATIQAYTYPDEFKQCDGSASIGKGVSIQQQARKGFGLCYRTRIGNDVDGDAKGYKIHLVYNAEAAPSEKNYQTVNDNPEAIQFSWEVDTTPIDPNDTTAGITGMRPTAHLIIDSTAFTTAQDLAKLAQLEDMLYGVDADAVHEITASDPILPSPATVVGIVGAAS